MRRRRRRRKRHRTVARRWKNGKEFKEMLYDALRPKTDR